MINNRVDIAAVQLLLLHRRGLPTDAELAEFLADDSCRSSVKWLAEMFFVDSTLDSIGGGDGPVVAFEYLVYLPLPPRDSPDDGRGVHVFDIPTIFCDLP